MKNKQYALTILTLVTFLNIVFYFTENIYFLWAAIVLGLIGIFFKFLAQIIHNLWFKLAQILGFVSSKIVLSITFFGILTPLALLSKIFKKEDKFKVKTNQDSNFVDKNEDFSDKSIFKKTW